MPVSGVTPAISVRDLVKVYAPRSGAPVRALDGLSLEVRRGEIYGLLGRNGAGKTTLLRILTTLPRHTAGSVSVMGHDVPLHPLEVRRSLCAVLQENAVGKKASHKARRRHAQVSAPDPRRGRAIAHR